MHVNDSTQMSLAIATQISQPTLSRILNGQGVSADDLAKLADHFGITMDALYRGCPRFPDHDLLVVTHNAITATCA